MQCAEHTDIVCSVQGILTLCAVCRAYWHGVHGAGIMGGAGHTKLICCHNPGLPSVCSHMCCSVLRARMLLLGHIVLLVRNMVTPGKVQEGFNMHLALYRNASDIVQERS